MSAVIGFLGCGHMSQAMISGLLNSDNQAINADAVYATCAHESNAAEISEKYKITCRTDNRWLCENSDLIVLGIKPQHMTQVLQEISQYNLNDKLIVTMCAGLHTASYREFLGDELPIVRIMPNLSAASGASITGVYSDKTLSDDENLLLDRLLTNIGDMAWLDDEIQLDGMTALSGSGIAYFFRFMEAMCQAGVQYGFERDELYDIIALTAMGAATLALENTDSSPSFAKLCAKVAVEGGTTAKGIAALERAQLDEMVTHAMDAVVEQSAVLRQSFGGNHD